MHFGLALTTPKAVEEEEDDNIVAAHLSSIADLIELNSYGVGLCFFMNPFAIIQAMRLDHIIRPRNMSARPIDWAAVSRVGSMP